MMKIHDNLKLSLGAKVPFRWGLVVAIECLGLMLFIGDCRAATFNWPATPAWTAGAPTTGNSVTKDYFPSTGQGISVTLTNSGDTWESGFPAREVVGSGATVTGGTANGTSSLQLGTSTTASTSSYVQVTINFNYTGGANNISFNLWDVDWGGNTSWIDQISNIQATAVGGGTVYPTTLTGSSANSVTGSGATARVTGTSGSGQTSANGNVTIGFTQTVTSVSFRWANTAPTARTTQYIAVSPVTFTGIGTPVPEVNSSVAALLLCSGVLGFARLRCHSGNAEGSHCLPSA
jgi:hypothetical protein